MSSIIFALAQMATRNRLYNLRSLLLKVSTPRTSRRGSLTGSSQKLGNKVLLPKEQAKHSQVMILHHISKMPTPYFPAMLTWLQTRHSLTQICFIIMLFKGLTECDCERQWCDKASSLIVCRRLWVNVHSLRSISTSAKHGLQENTGRQFPNGKSIISRTSEWSWGGPEFID